MLNIKYLNQLHKEMIVKNQTIICNNKNINQIFCYIKIKTKIKIYCEMSETCALPTFE